MAIKRDRVVFQPESTTKWGYDTVLLIRQYDDYETALADANDLRSRGWNVDYAYPHKHATGAEVFAVRKHDDVGGVSKRASA